MVAGPRQLSSVSTSHPGVTVSACSIYARPFADIATSKTPHPPLTNITRLSLRPCYARRTPPHSSPLAFPRPPIHTHATFRQEKATFHTLCQPYPALLSIATSHLLASECGRCVEGQWTAFGLSTGTYAADICLLGAPREDEPSWLWCGRQWPLFFGQELQYLHGQIRQVRLIDCPVMHSTDVSLVFCISVCMDAGKC